MLRKKLAVSLTVGASMAMLLAGCASAETQPERTISSKPTQSSTPSAEASSSPSPTTNAKAQEFATKTVNLVCGLTEKDAISAEDVQQFRDFSTEIRTGAAEFGGQEIANQTADSINSYADTLATIVDQPLNAEAKASLVQTCDSAQQEFGPAE